jgi:hypothetical protein
MSDTIFMKTCVCGRTFTDLGGFTRHEKSCSKGKKRLSGALTRVKEAYQVKRTRLSLSRSASADHDVIAGSNSCGEGDNAKVSKQTTQQVCSREISVVRLIYCCRAPPLLPFGIRNPLLMLAKNAMRPSAQLYVLISLYGRSLSNNHQICKG